MSGSSWFPPRKVQSIDQWLWVVTVTGRKIKQNIYGVASGPLSAP
jgi:hypothetical protein